jgi:hypothetical protein
VPDRAVWPGKRVIVSRREACTAAIFLTIPPLPPVSGQRMRQGASDSNCSVTLRSQYRAARGGPTQNGAGHIRIRYAPGAR